MNPLAILKGAKVFLIIGVISYGLVTVNSFMKDQRAMRDAVITVNAEKISAQARAETLDHANQELEAANAIEKEFREQTQKALNELNVTFTEIRKEQSKQSSVLEGNRLNELAVGRRATLIEKLINRASKARARELEEIFNDS